MEQAGIEPMPIWDAGIAGGGLTCYAIMPAPAKNFVQTEVNASTYRLDKACWALG